MKIKIWGVVYQIVNPGGFNKEEWFSPWVSAAVPSAAALQPILLMETFVPSLFKLKDISFPVHTG